MHTCAALLTAALVLVAQPRRGSAARDCYRPCMPSPEVCLADPRQCDDENCNTDPRPVKRGDCPPGFVENLRCVASMRREPLEIYMWGEIPPKPDDRTLPEKIECAPCLHALRLTFPDRPALRCLRRSGMAKGYDNRLCCNIDACSITDYKACMSQREADRLALLQGRRLEADVEAEQNTLERLRNELRTQELGQK